MLSFSQTLMARYSCAVVFACIALLVTSQIETVATQTPFALFFVAITLSSWLFGRAPGFLAEGILAIGAQFLLIPQLYSIHPEISRTFQFGSFILIGAVIVWLTSSLRGHLSSAREHEGRFGSLFEDNPLPVWIIDSKTSRFLAANKAATRVYGYSHDEFMNFTWADLGDADGFATSSPTGSLIETRSPPITVHRHKRKDGQSLYVELISKNIVDKKGKAQLVHAVDVTERVRTSDALRKSEYRLKEVFGSCPVSMTVHRWSDRTFLDVNSEFTDLTGWSLGEIQGKTVVECGLMSSDTELSLSSYLGDHSTIIDKEIEIITRTGKIRNVLIGAVLVDMLGEKRVIASFVDITELRRAEKRHRASEERLRIVTEKARVGLVMINDRRRFSFVNKAYAEIFDLPSSNILGRRVSEVHAELYEKQIEPSLERAFDGQSFRYELCQPTPNGTRYFDVRYEPTEEEGVIVSVVAVVTDVTERMRAELAREASEERYRTLFEYSPDGIAIVDPESFYIDANETLCRMLGYTRDEFIGFHATNIFVPLEVPHLNETLFGLNCDLEYYQEWTYRRKDGSTFPGEVVATVMPDGNMLTVIRDITERKHLEDQLFHAQKMEAIGVLAGGVAHDFNNILTAIAGYSDLTLQKMPADDPLRDYVVEISQASERAAALTNQLLSFSRHRVVTPAINNLNLVVRETEKMLRRIVKENIQFRIDLDSDLRNVQVDPNQMIQVIVNLVVNAGDAMPEGGRLTITTRNTYLDGDYSHENVVVTSGPFVELIVKDNGIGMDAQTRRRLFEPFYTTKENGKGTGLGLSTVYGIVKQSGGDISVESEQGKGTTFRIFLPAVSASTKYSIPVIKPSEAIISSGTILLVEDETPVRNLIDNILTRGGYEVIAVDSGEKALSVCATFPNTIHLLLSDMIMPGMNGVALQNATVKIRPEIRSIIMSGYPGESQDNISSLESSANFIRKPFTPGALIAKVRAVLSEGDIVSAISSPESPSSARAATSR